LINYEKNKLKIKREFIFKNINLRIKFSKFNFN